MVPQFLMPAQSKETATSHLVPLLPLSTVPILMAVLILRIYITKSQTLRTNRHWRLPIASLHLQHRPSHNRSLSTSMERTTIWDCRLCILLTAVA